MALLRVTLSPKFDEYYPKVDLENYLDSHALAEFKPTDKGRRRSFLREIRNIEARYGVEFKVIKETTWDMMWNVFLGNRQLGTYMLIYGVRTSGKNKKATFENSKSRKLPKARFNEDRELFDNISKQLDDVMDSPMVNSYTIHKRVLEWFKQNADVVQERDTGFKTTDNPNKSFVFYMAECHKKMILNLIGLYALFNMHIDLQEVE